MDLWTFAARQGAMDSLWTTKNTLTTGSPHPRPTSSTGSTTGYIHALLFSALRAVNALRAGALRQSIPYPKRA